MCTENSVRLEQVANRLTSAMMIALFSFCLTLFVSPFKSKSRLEAENAALRHQLIMLRRKVWRVHSRTAIACSYPAYRWVPSILRRSQLSGRRPSCAGIVPAFATTGVGNPALSEAGRKSTQTCGC